MCGRYVSPDTASIVRAWRVGRTTGNPFPRRFNVVPATDIPILRGDPRTGELILLAARWGFIPPWWTHAKPPNQCFNARSEEASSKPVWRLAYRESRCLIPAEGWYEWTGAERIDAKTGEIRSRRQPHFIFRGDREPFCFAGLMTLWKLPGQLPRITCAILTRAATPSVRDIHDRMPVVIAEADIGKWLDHGADAAALIERAESDFTHYPVSTRLNATVSDDAALLEPAPPRGMESGSTSQAPVAAQPQEKRQSDYCIP